MAAMVDRFAKFHARREEGGELDGLVNQSLSAGPRCL
jgi:hypothetical protein